MPEATLTSNIVGPSAQAFPALGRALGAPVFSVATPTRNALPYLKRCIGSLRGQNFQAYEHLVQDACSSDGTSAWLATQGAADAALRPCTEADSGMYDAINRAWSRSQGQILSWLNSDEQYLPGTLARVQEFFESHPAVDVLFADYLVVDEQGHAVALRREIPLRRFYVANSFLNAQSCTMFFRRRLWDSGALRLDTRYRYAADKELLLRLLAQSVEVRHLPELLSIFGIDGCNMSTHAGMEREAEEIRLAYGGFRVRAMRSLPLLCRRVERLLRGAYVAKPLSYRFAIDEAPRYAEFQAVGLGGRYTLARPRGRVEKTRFLDPS